MPGRDARTGAPRAQERTQPRPASSKRPAAAGEEPRSDYSRKNTLRNYRTRVAANGAAPSGAEAVTRDRLFVGRAPEPGPTAHACAVGWRWGCSRTGPAMR